MALAVYGTGVSSGIAIGRAHVVRGHNLNPQEQPIKADQVEAEIRRFRQAVRNASDELKHVRRSLPADTPTEVVEFIDIHVLMLADSSLTEAPVTIITEQQCNAQWALNVQRNRLKSVFEQMHDPYIGSRADDVDQVVGRILNQLNEKHSPSTDKGNFQGLVLVADDIDPASFLLLHNEGIAGLITEQGGPLSHTAILARSLKMPAVMGLRNAPRLVHEGEMLLLDGARGVAVAKPSQVVRRHYRQLLRNEVARQADLQQIRRQPTRTLDHCAITLQANVDLAEDMALARKNGAQGVGLFRTEYLFLNRETPPDEDEQYQAYADLVGKLGGAATTIRTLDLGADKQLPNQKVASSSPTFDPNIVAPANSAGQVNPALGLRAVRLCLSDQDLFLCQLRAILRATAHGPVKILIPMLCNTQELFQVRLLVQQAERELRKSGVRVGDYQLGGMIEVPAAALSARAFAKNLDFLSIGTNDLIQYTLAIDRVDDQVGYLYDPLHPSVLKLLQMTIEAAKAVATPVSLCGEMAADTTYTRLLLGLGLRDFSVSPARLLEVRQVVNRTDLTEITGITRRIMRTHHPSKIAALVRELNQR
ncbi:MAG: phosphoenolpyruvate--protein phosphotransferase [Lysobacterales bacterium]